MTTQTLMTIAQFEQFRGRDDRRYELDRGQLIEMTFPKPRHNLVVGEVYTLLRTFVRQHNLGAVFPSDTGFVLSEEEHLLKGPDVAFVRRERLSGMSLDENIRGAPDLVVEVVSPNDQAADLNLRVQQFLAAGAQVVWLFYPDSRQVTVWQAHGAARTLSGDDRLEAPTLLPGFSISVSELFASALPEGF